MIFGFNTDVKFGDTVYHVQSEAREHEHLLQTLVFVKGRCLGKHASSYADLLQQPDFSEERIHAMLKEQHHHFVEVARQGSVENEITPHENHENVAPAPAQPVAESVAAPSAVAVKPAPAPPELTMQPVGSIIGKGLTIACLAPSLAPDGSSVTLYVQVAEDGGDPASDAQLTCRITSSNHPSAYVYGQSGPGGMADIAVALHGLDLSTTTVLVQASYRGKSVSRKFSLKKK